MKMKKLLTYLLVFTAFGNTSQAFPVDKTDQKTIKENIRNEIPDPVPGRKAQTYMLCGTVSDGQGIALPGANVTALGTTLSVGTDSNGEFRINLQKEKEYILSVSYMGYITREITVNGKDWAEYANGNRHLKIMLEESHDMLEECVVTGTRTEIPLKNVPVITRMISRREIEKINTPDMTTLLQYELPGIQFGNHHGSGMPTMTYQGVDANYMLFLIDGERISGEGAADNVDFNRFNVDEIERIEVVKGAASTLYGSNALGGVINIITKNADRPFTGNFSQRYSTNGEFGTSLSLGGKWNWLSVYATGSFRQRNPYQVKDNSIVTETTTDSSGNTIIDTLPARVSSFSGYQIGDESLKFKFNFSERLEGELKQSFYHNRQLPYGDDVINYNTSMGNAVSARMKYLVGKASHLDFTYVYDNYLKRKHLVKLNTARLDYMDQKHTGRLNFSSTLSENDIFTAGLEVTAENLKHYMFKDSSSRASQNYSLYMQEERRHDRFSVVTGLRLDYHDRYGLHVTPRISGMLKLSDFTLRGGYAQGFRAPSLKELYSEYDMGGLGIFIIRGNENLKPETSHQFTLAAEYSHGIWYASVSGFYNRFIDKIGQQWQINDATGKEDLVYVNADDAMTAGAEVMFRVKLDCGFSAQVVYSYTEDFQYVNGFNTSTVRPHNITGNISYNRNFRKGYSLSANIVSYFMSGKGTYTWNEDNGYTYRYYDPRYVTSLNVGAGFPRGFRLIIGVDNIFNYQDKNISSTSTLLPERGIGVSATLRINLADLFRPAGKI